MALPVIALAVIFAFKTDSVYEFYIGFKNSGLRYLFTGILYFAVACALLNTLKESYRYRKTTIILDELNLSPLFNGERFF